jgi:cyclic 2,3-diphosphoglycerate synthetase
VTYVRDFFGPFRLARADLAIIATAEEPVASPADIAEIRAAITEQRPDLPVAVTTFRPAPIESVAGKRVFFATTAPEAIVPRLVGYLESEFGCTVVGASANLSNRSLLRAELESCAGSFDLLLTELKAAAIDVVAAEGEALGVPTVLCDNVPVAVDGSDLGALVDAATASAVARGRARVGEVA